MTRDTDTDTGTAPTTGRGQAGLRVVVAVLGIGTALLLGTAVVDSILSQEDTTAQIEGETVALDETGEFVALSDTEGYDETIRDSPGNGVRLTQAADSYLSSSGGIAVGNDTWTVATWARINSSVAGSETAVLDVDGRLVVTHNGSVSEWQIWYYDEPERNSYAASVSAPNQPGSYTHIQVQRNATHLQVYRNNTLGATVDVTTANSESAPSAADLHGSLDEIRTFNRTLSDSVLTSLTDSPIAPRPGTNRTARLIINPEDGSTQDLYFASSDVTLSNHSFVSGAAPGQELTAGSDYDWQRDGPRLKPLASGEIDGAPAAYASYTRKGSLAEDLTKDWQSVVSLAMLVGMIALVVVILGRLQQA